MRKLSNIILAFAILLLMAAAGLVGFNLQPEVAPIEARVPYYIEIPVEVPVEKTITVEVDKIVEKPVTVEVIKPLKDFASLNELDSFLETYQPLKTYVPGGQLLGQCEDYALDMIAKAEAQGYKLHMSILLEDSYRKFYNYDGYWPPKTCHAICGAIIGDSVYFIEPLAKKYWLAAYLD